MRPKSSDFAMFFWAMLILVGVCLMGYFVLGALADAFL